MTSIEQLRTNIESAQGLLHEAMGMGDVDEVQAFVIRAANALLQASPKPFLMPRTYCVNPDCRRLITERDPVFGGHCSTICREGFNLRVLRNVHAKYEGLAAR
jgi:hypothetical protein